MGSENCAICLGSLRSDCLVRRLPCGHRSFHAHCLEDYFVAWIAKHPPFGMRGGARLGARRPTCPICRRPIEAEDSSEVLASDILRWLNESGDEDALWVLQELARQRPELVHQARAG